MKATLILLEASDIRFRCETQEGDGLEPTVLHMRMTAPIVAGAEDRNDVHVYRYEQLGRADGGRWNEDNANPHRQGSNSVTKAVVVRSAAYKAAVAAVRERLVEISEEYKNDHSLLKFRREAHDDRALRKLAELKAAIAADVSGVDTSGDIELAASRYSEACDDRPQPLDNPWAWGERIRHDNRLFARELAPRSETPVAAGEPK